MSRTYTQPVTGNRAIKLSQGRPHQDARWLVHLDCPPEWGITSRRTYIYAADAEEAIKRAQKLSLPMHYRDLVATA